MSMAAGEYVSVHSQADTEKADLKLERAELKTDNAGEHTELAAIYVARGLDPKLAKQVAAQLMAHDAFWGALAMALTAGVGALFGTAVH
jgi:VIT1/CCC1 family predicted Fe2+/Mn2+ transporter